MDGHGGEVLQVHLDDAVPPAVPVGELLEVERRSDAERHRQERGEHHQPERAEDAGAEAGGLRADDGGVVGEQLAVEATGALDRGVDDERDQSTMTPKKRENQRSPRKTRDLVSVSLLSPGRDGRVTHARWWVAMLISTPA